MNIKNAKKLLAHLVRQQKSRAAARFNMHYWGISAPRKSGLRGVLEIPVCKTQACLAGETVLALGAGKILEDGGIILTGRYRGTTSPYAAGNLLGLHSEAEQARLFAFKKWGLFNEAEGWPKNFEKAYRAAKTPAKRLGVAIARVKHFIKTNGAE